MSGKKFIIDGREYEAYQLSNEQLIHLIKDDKNLTDDERSFLSNKIIERFEYDLCPKCGENEDDVFARFFGNFVNGKLCSKKKVRWLN